MVEAQVDANPEDVAREAAAAFEESVRIMARLRGPDGCPWDQEQSFDTIKRYTLEETYEVFDAIERRAWPELKDELGDLLLQVLFYAQMAGEAGFFTMADVAAGLNAKLIRRHPHVFGDAEATTSDAVLRNWEQIKLLERAVKETVDRLQPASSLRPASGLLEEVPRTMPAVMEAHRLGSKAAKVGFDWPSAAGLFAKLDEEIGELQAEIGVDGRISPRAEDELGDLLFTAINLARHLKVDPESALRKSNAKFRARFEAMERAAGGREGLIASTAEELEGLWAEAKQGTA